MTNQTQQSINNIDEFSKKSQDYYDTVKSILEKEALNKYVALNFEIPKYWIGDTASEALTKAKTEYPKKLFYLIQVGSPTTFSIQSLASNDFFGKRGTYDIVRSHR